MKAQWQFLFAPPSIFLCLAPDCEMSKIFEKYIVKVSRTPSEKNHGREKDNGEEVRLPL
jgi:hypothetical protein